MAKGKKPAKAKKPAAAAKPKPDKKQTRKQTTQGAGLGHNITEIRAQATPFFEKMFNLQADMDSDAAGYRSDFKNLYEEAANAMGVKKSVVIKEYKRALRNKREQEKERMMDAQERDTAETLRAAMEGTPMYEWFAGQIAKPNEDTAEEEAEDEAEKVGAD